MKIYTVALLLCCLAGAAYTSCMSGGSSCGGGGIDVVTTQQQIFPLSYYRTTISSTTTITKTTSSSEGILVVAPDTLSPYCMTRSYTYTTSFLPCGSRVLYATDSITSYVSSYISYFDIRTRLFIFINIVTGEYIYYDTSSCGGGNFYRVFFNPYTLTTYLVEVYSGQLYLAYVDCNGFVTITQTSYLPDAAFQLYGQISLSLIITNGGSYSVQSRDLFNGVVIDISVNIDLSTNLFIISDFLGFEYAVVYTSEGLVIQKAFKTFTTNLIYVTESGGGFCSLGRIIDSVDFYQTSCTSTSVSPYIRSREVRSIVAPSSVAIDLDMFLTIVFSDGTQRQFTVTIDGGIFWTTSVGGYKLLVYVDSNDGIVLYRTMLYNNDIYVISQVTRQLMRVVYVNGIVTFVVIEDASFVVNCNFLMYNVQYSIETIGGDLFLVVVNIDINIRFKIPIVIINGLYVVTDYLTGIEYVVVINADGSIILIQCWVDGNNVLVEYEMQFAIITIVQQTYVFTSIEWDSVIGIIENDLCPDSQYYVPCRATQTVIC